MQRHYSGFIPIIVETYNQWLEYQTNFWQSFLYDAQLLPASSNWTSLYCRVNVLLPSTKNSVYHCVHTAWQVPVQHFDAACWIVFQDLKINSVLSWPCHTIQYVDSTCWIATSLAVWMHDFAQQWSLKLRRWYLSYSRTSVMIYPVWWAAYP